MAQAELPLPARGFGETTRQDAWWVAPFLVFLVLSAFVVYATWAALQGEHYHWGPYLSPFYSPELFGDSPHAWFGSRPSGWPGWLPFSPAILILWAPGLFRLTCYYYRGAYYKSFWADPPSCAVGEPRECYLGERSLPLILQNVHRYFLYLAVLFLAVLSWDVWKAFWFEDAAPGEKLSFGVGVGTLVLATNLVLLAGYTLGCHSMRHLAGGALDEITRVPLCRMAYDGSSALNRFHHRWAWLSLFSVAFSDVYVRMLALGVWSDLRLL